MSEITDVQRAARRDNAATARAARSASAAARRAEAEADLDRAYGPVRAEIDGAVDALVKGKPALASRRIELALVLLGRVAVSGPWDPARSRSAMHALREAQREADRRRP